MKTLIKDKYFIIGSSFIFVLLLLSFLFPIYIEDHLSIPKSLIYNKDHQLVAKPPYPPSWQRPFGVDRFQQDVFWLVIDGAKYTVLLSLVLGLLRIFFGVGLGILYGLFHRTLYKYCNPFIEIFQYIPAVLLTIIIYASFQIQSFIGSVPSSKETIVLLFSIIVVAIPTQAQLTASEVSLLKQAEFMTSARVLGGSTFYLFKKHILPYLKPRLFLWFIQQTIQTLILFIHLGIFHIFIGGAVYREISEMGVLQKAIPISLTNEWAGLISLTYKELMLDKWIVLGPSIAFVLTILSFKLIAKSIEKMMNSNDFSPLSVDDARQETHYKEWRKGSFKRVG